MTEDVTRFVRGCSVCAMVSTSCGLPEGKLVPPSIPRRPWSHLGIDFATDLPVSNGFTTILVTVDRFSKACKLIPLKGLPTALETAEALFSNVFRYFGINFGGYQEPGYFQGWGRYDMTQEDWTDAGTTRMSAPDPIAELVEALRRTLNPAPAAAPAAVTSASTASSASPPMIASPVAIPVPFSGSAGDCNGFLLQCSLVLEMQPHLYPDNRAKVAFIISRLDGKALHWAEPLWTQNHPTVTSLSSFLEHFREVFGTPAGDSSIGERLCTLRQGSMMVSDYALQFRTLAAASGWNEQALITTYRQGLDPRIRLHLAAYEDSIGLEKFIQLSIRFATHMQLCLEEHQAQPLFPAAPHRPERVSRPEPAEEPMDLEHLDLAATERQRERQRRLAQNRCFYCGRSGHFIAECPTRPA
ncbi:hypothetical protein QTP70_031637 [Hemibagrus guttatus]|uniref:CCHC-type domain-containing protein n=1 Tax=Hemibagrus guttatus TaxID=175788 RepID=A0AAE0RGU1_9TELE|nr:hypothetical protein QTP70_031637 [Hemibagrus guttatus]